MGYDKCKRCGEYTWNAACRCQLFYVAATEWDISNTYHRDADGHGSWGPPYVIDWHERWAMTASDAAEHYVQVVDQANSEGLSETTHVLVNREPAVTPEVQFITVTGEMVPEYWPSVDAQWEVRAARMADEIGAELPEEQRPQTRLGSNYFSEERIAARALRSAKP